MNNPSLTIASLVVGYRRRGLLELLGRDSQRVDVIAGLDLEVQAGETVALVGESGCGKTTLARAILGLTPILEGQVRVNGVVASGSGDLSWRPIRRQVGLLFQDPVASLNPRMTVAALVTEAFRIHRIGGVDVRKEARQLLNQVGLPARFLDRYPHQLSGGQARRVSMARAMALRPKLVIADEPTAGLDLSVQGEVLNLMVELQATLGVSFLLITHNLAIARHVADRVAVMYLGKVVESGATEALYAQPAHPYTRALMSTRGGGGGSGGARVVLRGESPNASKRPLGCVFSGRCDIAQPRCSTEAPPARTLPDGRTVSCHYPLVHRMAS
jgi:oligopeptide/dipeptide ABC transporter ATP-binding protein